MGLAEFWDKLVTNIQQTGWKEWVSTITQIASVWYARKNNVLVYPTGIIGVGLAAYLYFFDSHPPLYADGTLNIYYFFMSVYGWYNWMQKKDAEHFTYPISWCSKKELSIGAALFIISWGAIYFGLTRSDSNTAILESLVSASAVVAMWWMAKRKIENWLAWIISNIVAIPLNFYKEFYLFTLMYVLFFGMALWGFIEWKKQASKNQI